MGLRILSDTEQNIACLYCSTSDTAFGPVFYGSETQSAEERLGTFLKWLDKCPNWQKYEKYRPVSPQDYRRDPRILTESGLNQAFSDFLHSSEHDDLINYSME